MCEQFYVTLNAYDTEILPPDSLEILCLDCNALVELPEKMNELVLNLEVLMVWHNQLKELCSKALPSLLRIRRIWSNQLTKLNALMNSDGEKKNSILQLPTKE
jgi:hypothetical protein